MSLQPEKINQIKQIIHNRFSEVFRKLGIFINLKTKFKIFIQA